MNKQGATTIIAVLSLLATILIGCATIYAMYGTALWGGIPPKRLEVEYTGPSNPLDDLQNSDAKLSIHIQSDGDDISNIRIVQASLKNTSTTSPIVPSDMFKPLSLVSEKYWKIINVTNSYRYRELYQSLKWHKVNDSEFSSEPTLLNPGDEVSATVYLSWTGDGSPPETKDSPVSWQARISNADLVEVNTASQIKSKLGPIYTVVWGWGIPLFMATFFVYLSLTVFLLAFSGLISLRSPWTLIFIPILSLVNLSAADSSNTYIYGRNPLVYVPAENLTNLPPLVLNVVLLCVLGALAIRKSRG